VPQILLHKVIIAKDVEDAEQSLLNLAGLRRYMGGLRTEAEKKDFRSHLRKYINMYLPDSPFEVSTTNRYTITAQEASVTARKRIREGDKINYLCGTLVPLTDAELQDLDLTQRNFSIVQSDRKKNTLIFLGPARFANHDCAANGRLVSVGKDGLEVHATRNIDVGEEITVTYSPGYFGANNEECLCHTCELQARNGWTSTDVFGAPQSGESTPIPGEALSESPYSFRKKRRHSLNAGSASSASSPSPSKKQKLDRPPSRLNQVFTPPLSSVSPEPEVSPVTADGDQEASESSPPNKKRSLLDVDAAEYAPLTSAGLGTALDPPRKKRMRLIDQMTSSAGSSPELLTKSRPCSSISDESGNDSSSSKNSSCSTQATSVLEAPVGIKVEGSEISEREGNDTSSSVRELLISTVKPPEAYEPPSTKFSLNPTHAPTINIKPSSSIMPSIETTTTTTLTVLPDPQSPPTIRTPGDYVLTRRLVAQPFDRWVQCQTCADHFLQSNGYQTRRECPRCERHSMLYGFGWPKTEPDARRLREINEEREKAEKKMGRGKGGKKRGGTGDTIVVSHVCEKSGEASATGGGNGQRSRGGGLWGRGRKGGGRSGRSGKGTWVEGGGEDEREERVMDHRTVNRFIAPEEERQVRKRGRNNSLLGFTNGAAVGGGGIGGKDTGSATPDLTPARPRGSVFVERGASASMREESVGSSAFEDGDGVLRRSKRYFGSRMTM
jgi:[histone H4]-N-methyl-L-lysine20 N-methyltransferase